MSNEIFLIAAYLIIWGGLFAYLFFANGQQHKLARRVAILEEIVSGQGAEND
jgi:CcmD family protein